MVVLCGCFKKGCLQVLGEFLSGSLGYDSVHVKVTLVSDKDERERWIAEEVYKLIIEGLHHLEALLAVDGVDQDISVNIHGVLGGEDAVLVLACCVDHKNLVILALYFHILVECVFYRGII